MEALEYTWPFNKGFKRKIKAEGGNWFVPPTAEVKKQAGSILGVHDSFLFNEYFLT
jgi:hypothetical protein